MKVLLLIFLLFTSLCLGQMNISEDDFSAEPTWSLENSQMYCNMCPQCFYKPQVFLTCNKDIRCKATLDGLEEGGDCKGETYIKFNKLMKMDEDYDVRVCCVALEKKANKVEEVGGEVCKDYKLQAEC